MSASQPTPAFQRHGLASRIVIAFTLMATTVAGLFSVGVILAIGMAEQELVTEGMSRQLDFVIASGEDSASRQLSAGLHLYRSGAPGDPPLPAWLQGYGPGFHEIIHDGMEYETLFSEHGPTRYVLLLDQEDFERHERTTFLIVGAGFLLSALTALVLGLLTARRVIAPVVRLAGQVQHRDQLLPLAPPLAPDYPADEVGQLAAAFDSTLGQLRQALQRETLFTSDVSHELRTPLMVIASSCELLLEELPVGSREHTQLLRLHRSCGEMRELIETFLWLARGASGRNPLASDTTLAAVAEEQRERWAQEAAQRGLAFHLEGAAAHPDAPHYPAPLLRAVMSNLLRNALHYTDRGSVRLTLHADGFDVADTGAGIPEAERLDIFRPFIRGSTSRGDGIGLGLSLVQRICSQQGWQVSLEANPGGGCLFRVNLQPR